MANENKKAEKETVKKKETKDVGVKLAWFKPADVVKEIKRIRWPKFAELMSDSAKVIFFGVAFGVFFVVCNIVLSKLLLLLGVGA